MLTHGEARSEEYHAANDFEMRPKDTGTVQVRLQVL